TIATIQHRDESTAGHENRAQPDEWQQRLVADPKAPCFFAKGVPHRHVNVASPARIDPHLRQRHLLYDVVALLRIQGRDGLPAACDLYFALHRRVVRSLHRTHTHHLDVVARDLLSVTRLHTHITLAVIRAGCSNAEDEERDAKMRDAHAKHARGEGMLVTPALDGLNQRAESHPDRGHETERRQDRLPAVHQCREHHATHDCDAERDPEPGLQAIERR